MFIEKVYFRKDVLREQYLKDEGLAVYTALRQKSVQGIEFESYQHMAYLLSGEINSKSGLINKIKEGLENLADLGLIKILAATKIGAELDTSALYFSTTQSDKDFAYFFIVQRDEISKIFTADNNKHPMKMLRYFCCIIDSISNGSDNVDYHYWENVGCHSVSNLAKAAHISESAALDYNNFLENLKLISICRAPEGIVDENGRIINGLTNCYGRPEHFHTIEEFQSKRIEVCSSRTAPFGKKTNKKRSMKQKYNEALKGKEYSQAELREIQEHFEKINSDYDKGIAAIAQKYKNDEISFEQYDDEIKCYQESHEKIDLTPITDKLVDVWSPRIKQTSNVKRTFHEGIDDSLDDFFCPNFDSANEAKGNTNVVSSDGEAFLDADRISFMVVDSVVMNWGRMIKKGIMSEAGIRHQLKNTYMCDAELVEKYMAAIEKCKLQEYDAII